MLWVRVVGKVRQLDLCRFLVLRDPLDVLGVRFALAPREGVNDLSDLVPIFLTNVRNRRVGVLGNVVRFRQKNSVT